MRYVGERASEAEPLGKGAGKTVLVMDDSEIVLELLARALSRIGCEVLTASNVRQLEAHLARSTPALLVLDVQMPEIDGDELGRTLKMVRSLKARVVLFSSMSEDALSTRARGLDGYVCKAAGVDAVVSKVRAALAS